MKLFVKLRVFLAVRGISQKDFAVKCCVSAQTIKNWCGRGQPITKIKLTHAQKLHELTNGFITLKDCNHK